MFPKKLMEKQYFDFFKTYEMVFISMFLYYLPRSETACVLHCMVVLHI